MVKALARRWAPEKWSPLLSAGRKFAECDALREAIRIKIKVAEQAGQFSASDNLLPP